MSRITADEVRELALLARLHLSDLEVAAMTDNLGAILEYVDALRALDTSAIEPMTHAVPFDCPTRPDEVKPSLPLEEALANAPRRDGSFFQVPRIMPGPGADGEGTR
jgi:aspartyl-tRNA(Asn)/glutamyl-tRNA(Gln) amidotransferase subunit C